MSEEVEQLRVQLAGCGVVASCNTRASLAQQMPEKGAYGHSQSLENVYDASLREIHERERADAYRAAIIKIIPLTNRAALETMAGQLHDGPFRDPELVELLTEAANKA